MAEIVNLRMARKRKARDEREREADRNRVLHGRSKAEKQRLSTEQERADRFVDGHRREAPQAVQSSGTPETGDTTPSPESSHPPRAPDSETP